MNILQKMLHSSEFLLLGTGIDHTDTEETHKDSPVCTWPGTFRTVCCHIQVGTLHTAWSHTHLIRFEHMSRTIPGTGCHKADTLQFPVFCIDLD